MPSPAKRRRQTQGSTRPRGGTVDPALRRRTQTIVRRLAREYGDAGCALEHDGPLELLVATILSAQCTDERVNQVTRRLFRKYRTARDYAESPPGALEEDIRSTGFFNNKARSIRAACRQLVTEHRGRVPKSMEQLLSLQGVARKTANVVLGVAFGKAEGVVVDTHVRRISRLLGLSHEQDPEKIERDLMALLPRSRWISFSHWLIWHGRRVCIARRPRCGECVLESLCPSASSAESLTATAARRRGPRGRRRDSPPPSRRA